MSELYDVLKIVRETVKVHVADHEQRIDDLHLRIAELEAQVDNEERGSLNSRFEAVYDRFGPLGEKVEALEKWRDNHNDLHQKASRWVDRAVAAPTPEAEGGGERTQGDRAVLYDWFNRIGMYEQANNGRQAYILLDRSSPTLRAALLAEARKGES